MLDKFYVIQKELNFVALTNCYYQTIIKSQKLVVLMTANYNLLVLVQYPSLQNRSCVLNNTHISQVDQTELSQIMHY
jgi:hypothetical protein